MLWESCDGTDGAAHANAKKIKSVQHEKEIYIFLFTSSFPLSLLFFFFSYILRFGLGLLF